MKNIVIIYWSGTGNTKKMALAVAEGSKADGVDLSLLEAGKASKEDVLQADGFALGCPSMGCEVLEEEAMDPLVQSLEAEDLTGKPLVLFGSYDWGDGQWMRDWEERMKQKGVRLVAEGLIIQNTPDEEGLARCRELGEKLAALIL
jgi:flavodoxin short chain